METDKRDLLDQIVRGEITDKKAQSIFDEAMAGGDCAGVCSLLGMSRQEYTACCHGTPLQTVARWRGQGWPARCFKCGMNIDIEAYGWWAGDKRRGRYCLRHITCPTREKPVTGKGLYRRRT